jgi:hypothetical protein
MKYLITFLFILSILFDGFQLSGVAICCLFLLTFIFTYYIFKAIEEKHVYIFVKNLVGLSFVLSDLFCHFGMPELVPYCVLVPGLFVGYYILKAFFSSGKSESDCKYSNDHSPEDITSSKYTYTATKNKSTSF